MPGTKQLFKVLAGALLVVAMLVQDSDSPLTRGAGGLWAQDDETAEEVFRNHISGPVVQSKCVNCHVAGGLSGNTRLVFVRSSDAVDHTARNLRTFENLLDDLADEGGGSYVLNKIQGVAHGGGVQVPLGSADFANMERFLGLLGEEITFAALTPETLFDAVVMASPRKTLRRAALIFAGRIPTDAEYAAVEGGDEWALRATIRGLMEGPQFHEFLIRASNDRLLTDREYEIIDPDGYYVDFTHETYRRTVAVKSGDERALIDFHAWFRNVQYGARRAPLELIAYVVENDLPYTEILTADYIMANPWAAAAYGAPTRFDDPTDPYEFKPSQIVSYYRHGDGYEAEYDPVLGWRVLDPGPLITDYPHAGILNTEVFLQRYPTTATNRNRARARWTYYHFLGLDVEKSASRTTDPVALADTHNPTLHNPACTVCHSVLDPVAGAFQNYDDDGVYKANWGGLDSLDLFYKYGTAGPALAVQAESWAEAEQETLSWSVRLTAGVETLSVVLANDLHNERLDADGYVNLDRLSVIDVDGQVLVSHEFEELTPPSAGYCGGPRYDPATGRDNYFVLVEGGHECLFYIEVDIPISGVYEVKIVAWSNGWDEWYGERGEGGFAEISVSANPYREGDTWYRDMRIPGFGGKLASDSDNSVQWLAQQIVADPRFAQATVKFWWPAIMGSEVAEPPEDAGDAGFEGRLLAANAQDAEVVRLADGFRDGFPGSPYTYNLKDLLVEIVLSEWFRADAVTDADPVRRVALHDAGAMRLLTPRELARKTAAVTGVQWGRGIAGGIGDNLNNRWPSMLTGDHRILYGGIDSDGITERARDITSVMAGVAQRHAAVVSCPVVMRELYLLPDAERRLFAGIDPHVTAAGAIRNKLVELHDKLFGIQVTPDSPEVDAAYQLFVDVWQRKHELEGAGANFRELRCDWDEDLLFFEGILDDVWVIGENVYGPWYRFDWNRVDDFLDGIDFSDPHYTAQTWVAVLATMMMDYRYLYLQ